MGVVDLWIFVALIVLAVLYGIVLFKLYRMTKEGDDENEEHTRKKNERIKRVMAFIGIYPIAYLFQWLAYALFKLDLIEATWGFLLYLVVTTNFGGCYNFLLYGRLLFNQIKRSNNKKKKRLEKSVEMNENEKSAMSGTSQDNASMGQILSTSAASSPSVGSEA